MTNFYFIRHGQTAWNVAKKLQGRADSPLTAAGIAQATAAAPRLSPLALAACYCSPAPRARHTAELLLRATELPINIDARLAEIDIGAWEGQDYTALAEPELQNFWHQPHLYDPTPNGGENFAQVTARLLAALADMAARHARANVLIVSHGVAITAILNHFANIPLADFWQSGVLKPCELSQLAWQAKDNAQVVKRAAGQTGF